MFIIIVEYEDKKIFIGEFFLKNIFIKNKVEIIRMDRVLEIVLEGLVFNWVYLFLLVEDRKF